MINDDLPYAAHTSPWYRPGHIKISDGTYMSMISPMDSDLMGIQEIGRRLNISLGILWQLAKIEKIPFYKYNLDAKFYYEDDFKMAYEKHKPPENSEKKQAALDRWNHFFKPLRDAIEEGRIKPVHKIGDIEYYDMDEMKRLVDQMREEKK